MPPVAQLFMAMVAITAIGAGLFALRTRQREDVAVALFLIFTVTADAVRWWWLDGAQPLSLRWYADVSLLMGESASVAALGLVVFAKRSIAPAAALLGVAVLMLAADPRTVAWLYKAVDIAAVLIAMACIIVLWIRRGGVSVAVVASLLIVSVTTVGVLAHNVHLSDARVWRAHVAANAIAAFIAAGLYLRRIVQNEAS